MREQAERQARSAGLDRLGVVRLFRQGIPFHSSIIATVNGNRLDALNYENSRKKSLLTSSDEQRPQGINRCDDPGC